MRFFGERRVRNSHLQVHREAVSCVASRSDGIFVRSGYFGVGGPWNFIEVFVLRGKDEGVF